MERATAAASSSAAAAAAASSSAPPRPSRSAAEKASWNIATAKVTQMRKRPPAPTGYTPRPRSSPQRSSSDSKATAARSSESSRGQKRRRESSPTKAGRKGNATAATPKKSGRKRGRRPSSKSKSKSDSSSSSSSSSSSGSSSSSSSSDSSDSSSSDSDSSGSSSSGSSSSSSSASSASSVAKPAPKKRGRRPRAKNAVASSSTDAAAASSATAAASAVATATASPAAAVSPRKKRESRVIKYPGAKSFRLIHKNDYRHAPDSEVVQAPEDYSLCSCTLPAGADPEAMACVDETCLNRSLHQECSSLCAMGRRCGNQRFRTRSYAPVDVRPVGGKGHGLFATQALPKGRFVIEYVGEIVNGAEYERRIADYANSDHFYFMTLEGVDSIDATRKGNYSRFINHACQPNMETQKWEVGGMQCVGLFLTRDVEADEELTFDYKYERYGGKKQACLCGAKNCAKFLGGRPAKIEEEGACTCGGGGANADTAAAVAADADGDAPMSASVAADCPVHGKSAAGSASSAASAITRALDRMIAENSAEAVTRSTRDLLRPLPPRPLLATHTRAPSKKDETVAAAAAAADAPTSSPTRASRSAAAAAAAVPSATAAAASSSSCPLSAAVSDPAAAAEPHLRFPRALRKAVPLRLLQLFRLLQEAQRQLQLARPANAPPLPDLTAHTIRQMLQHAMPQVMLSQLFSTVSPLRTQAKANGGEAAADTAMADPPKSKRART